MKTLAEIIATICGLWLLIDLIGAVWFIVLHHRNELVADLPKEYEDIF